jgi:signal transduction histidine kinase
LCYHDFSTMKRFPLEPGLLLTLRVYSIVSLLVLLVLWNTLGPLLNTRSFYDWFFITPSTPILLFLIIYTTFPWWQKRMGRAFLPVALVLIAVQAIGGSYTTLYWFVPAGSKELTTLAFMLRLWVNFQLLVLFVGWQYHPRWALITGIGLSLLDATLAFPVLRQNVTLYPFYITIAVARMISVTAVGIGMGWMVMRQREHRAALAEANRRLTLYAAATEQLAVSQERNRMARELHDTLAHSLSGVIVQLEAAEALWDVNLAGARKMVEHVHQSARSGLTEVRRALTALRASPVEDLGLALAISDLAESVAARTELKLTLEVADRIENIPPEVEQCVYRVAQEALENVARHARAKSFDVSLARPNGHLMLTVKDDGQGFNSHAIDATRYGLKGLSERAEMVGGELHIESRLNHGTTVQLTIPLVE